MQSNWDSDFVQPVWPCAFFTWTHQSLRPSEMTLAAQSNRQPVLFFSVMKLQSNCFLQRPLVQMSANPSPRYM